MAVKILEQSESRTGRALLIEWANQQDHWIRAAVGEIIDSQARLTDEQIETYYDLLLREKGLQPTSEPVNVPLLVDKETDSDPEQVLSLTSLTNVKNVNALCTGQTIDFNPRLTVIFGENAAGKSGYVRILKGAAAVRTAESVLSDVTKERAEPSAKISYTLGLLTKPDDVKSVDWSGEKGVAPLTRLDVFDSKGVVLHVDQDLPYIYTPSDISLFPYVVEAIEKVRLKLDKAKQEATSSHYFANSFSKQGALYAKIETLGASTDVAEITKLADVTKEEEDSLSSLEERVSALRSGLSDAALQVAKNDQTWLNETGKLLAIAKAFDVERYNIELETLKRAEEALEAKTRQAFVSEGIPGVFEPSWQKFIQSANDYIGEHISHEYPAKGDSCAYCRQELSEAAIKLLLKYKDFCNNELSKAVSVAKEQLETISADLLRIDEAKLSKDCAARKGQKQADAWFGELESLCTNLSTVKTNVEKREKVDPALISSAENMAESAKKRITAVTQLIAELTTQGAAREKAFSEELIKLQSLKDRIALRGMLTAVLAYIDKAKWADKANTLLSKFKAINTSLTNLSKTASEQLLNQDFGKLFLAECTKLNAPSVTLDFSGKKGQAARKKYVSKDHKLSETLSEGEQKVIALADFIAESLLRKKSSPIVFDDPVNSLDYRRLKNVVDRIVALSRTRQVIIFTHNIWFATEILSRFDGDKDGCSYYDIYAEEGKKGIISGGTSPRTDTFNSLSKKLNMLIQSATSETEKEIRDVFIEKGYDVMRSICEIVVENELLQSVTKRHRSNVMFTALPKIKVDKLPAAVEAITPIFEKCCGIIASHSQPLETLNIRPTLTELQADWKTLKDARDAYIKD